MDDSAPATDVEAEPRDLRTRAYGPNSEILDDPDSLARLTDLEYAHLAVHIVARPADTHTQTTSTGAGTGPSALLVGDGDAAVPPAAGRASLWQRMTATRGRRSRLIAVSLAIIVAIPSAVAWYAAPRPEAILQPSGADIDGEILSLVLAAPLARVVNSTLLGYEPYRGVEPWVATNAQGARCLMAMERSTEVLAGIRCAPPEVDLMLDLPVWAPGDELDYMEGLPHGAVIRFQLHGDSVDALLYLPPSAG